MLTSEASPTIADIIPQCMNENELLYHCHLSVLFPNVGTEWESAIAFHWWQNATGRTNPRQQGQAITDCISHADFFCYCTSLVQIAFGPMSKLHGIRPKAFCGVLSLT
jgi:hypothetical protein